MGTDSSTLVLLASHLSFLWLIIQCCSATDTITRTLVVRAGETLTSSGKIYELGFFTPGNSTNLYLGLWYKRISDRKVLWVANRENPVPAGNSSATLTIGGGGNLEIVDGKQRVFWSTNISSPVNHSFAVLLDNGNFVLRNNVSGEVLWESFKHPSDTFLPGMMLGLSITTGARRFLTAWKTDADPAPGNFTGGLRPTSLVQTLIWNGQNPYWRSGPWNGLRFVGVPDMNPTYVENGYRFIPDTQPGNLFFTFNLSNSSYVRVMTLTSKGVLKFIDWDDGKRIWKDYWFSQKSPCDVYGTCGAFGVCSKNGSPICRCLNGYVPKNDQEWSTGNWTGGCVRRTELMCEKGNSSSGEGKNNGFLRMTQMKLPDFPVFVSLVDDDQCGVWCLNNCSCLAHAYVSGIGCLIWTESLLDIQEFSNAGEDLFIRVATSELGKGNQRTGLIISLSAASGIIVFGAIICVLCRWRSRQRGKKQKKAIAFALANKFNTPRDTAQEKQYDSSELPKLDFNKIVAATNNFSTENKLGEGGFGPVFKGELEDGQEIAVKKLSRCSGQGMEEFKNEIILISKLQHRNLVRLFGCCIEGEELLIVYEYMPNKSLDTFLFDSSRRVQLDWTKRFYIIQGISRGLMYLHRDSRLKIIHRDLKASNILLDTDMNPKIPDFGLARAFRFTQELANTHRVVGTFGYMSPEYAMGGIFSEKSDVFSFGILVLEIICGRKNTSFGYDSEHLSLIGHAWQLWSDGRALDFMDQSLANSFASQEVVRSMQIGLLCVQDHASDRPTISAVVLMLSSELDCPKPKRPTFTFQSLLGSNSQYPSNLQPTSSGSQSINEVTVSLVEGR